MRLVMAGMVDCEGNCDRDCEGRIVWMAKERCVENW